MLGCLPHEARERNDCQASGSEDEQAGGVSEFEDYCDWDKDQENVKQVLGDQETLKHDAEFTNQSFAVHQGIEPTGTVTEAQAELYLASMMRTRPFA
jgi:hypothetical protein